jgi:hypothetical protein
MPSKSTPAVCTSVSRQFFRCWFEALCCHVISVRVSVAHQPQMVRLSCQEMATAAISFGCESSQTMRYLKKGKVFPLTGLNRPFGIRQVKAPDCLDLRHYEGGNVVTLTHRPSSPPGVFLVLIFRGWVDPRAHGSVSSLGKNPQQHQWGSIARPSD